MKRRPKPPHKRDPDDTHYADKTGHKLRGDAHKAGRKPASHFAKKGEPLTGEYIAPLPETMGNSIVMDTTPPLSGIATPQADDDIDWDAVERRFDRTEMLFNARKKAREALAGEPVKVPPKSRKLAFLEAITPRSAVAGSFVDQLADSRPNQGCNGIATLGEVALIQKSGRGK